MALWRIAPSFRVIRHRPSGLGVGGPPARRFGVGGIVVVGTVTQIRVEDTVRQACYEGARVLNTENQRGGQTVRTMQGVSALSSA